MGSKEDLSAVIRLIMYALSALATRFRLVINVCSSALLILVCHEVVQFRLFIKDPAQRVWYSTHAHTHTHRGHPSLDVFSVFACWFL